MPSYYMIIIIWFYMVLLLVHLGSLQPRLDCIASEDPGQQKHRREEAHGQCRDHRECRHRQGEEFRRMEGWNHKGVGILPEMVSFVHVTIPPGPMQHAMNHVSWNVHQDISQQETRDVLPTGHAPMEVGPSLNCIEGIWWCCRDREYALHTEDYCPSHLQVSHWLVLDAESLALLRILPGVDVVYGSTNHGIHEQIRHRGHEKDQRTGGHGCYRSRWVADQAQGGQNPCEVNLANEGC